MIHPYETRKQSDPVPLSECRVLMVVDRPKKKTIISSTRGCQASSNQSAQWRPFFLNFSSRQEMNWVLTVPGGRHFRQIGQRADRIGCSNLETCFDQNTDKQPLDRLGRRLPTLFFSLLFSQTHKRGIVDSVIIYLDRPTRARVEMGGF